MSIKFSFLSPVEVEKKGCVRRFTSRTKGRATKSAAKEDRKFEAEGKGLDKAVCLCVRGTVDGQKKQMSVSFSGLQRGSLNIPHRQGEEEGKLINIRAESLANQQQGEGMSGVRRNWEGVRLPYAFFPPPFARERGRERAQNGRRESERVSSRQRSIWDSLILAL